MRTEALASGTYHADTPLGRRPPPPLRSLTVTDPLTTLDLNDGDGNAPSSPLDRVNQANFILVLKAKHIA